jgi:anhydro-N-acetylmuramic acid kinase
MNKDKRSKIFMGLISGTSMDGIDAALVDLATNTFITGITRPYGDEAKACLHKAITGGLQSLKTFSQLHTLLGREFAKVALELLNKTQIPASLIQAIGSHGQTLCHDPIADIPYTMQLGCAHTIAELTGITVVADFRTRDLIVGGQGAPLAPIYHQALFKGQDYPVAVVNIGGLSNLTYLADELTVSGYDTGPGNCLMDAWVFKHLGYDYDRNGSWASSGVVIEPLLERLLADPYFARNPPKSLDKKYFSLAWLARYLQEDYDKVDVQATLLMLTAKAIAQGINDQSLTPTRLFVCGGGTHNLTLLNSLAKLLPHIKVESTESININPDFIEALMFAWLAEKALLGIPIDLSQITGSKWSTILGAIYPAGINNEKRAGVM